MNIATKGKKYLDDSAVCFAFDEKLNLYFGAYYDTSKGRNIEKWSYVAITIDSLQIHGKTTIVPYGTDE